jgi:Flp pilus assembly pilin Flp
MSQFLRGFVRNSAGIAALEYALIAGLIFALVVAAVGVMGTSLTTAFANVGISLSTHATGT